MLVGVGSGVLVGSTVAVGVGFGATVAVGSGEGVLVGSGVLVGVGSTVAVGVGVLHVNPETVMYPLLSISIHLQSETDVPLLYLYKTFCAGSIGKPPA